MGLSCKPIGKTASIFRKLDNALELERVRQMEEAKEEKKKASATGAKEKTA